MRLNWSMKYYAHCPKQYESKCIYMFQLIWWNYLEIMQLQPQYIFLDRNNAHFTANLLACQYVRLFNVSESFDSISATWHGKGEREWENARISSIQYQKLNFSNCFRNWICIFIQSKIIAKYTRINDIICGSQVANFQSKRVRSSVHRQSLFRYFAFSTACVQHNNFTIQESLEFTK